jgi:transcriptional regulator with XRE-family HTH domain
MDIREFGAAVRAARKEKDWSQEDLAEKVESKVTTISEIERGARSRPRGNLFERIADVLGVEPPAEDLSDAERYGQLADPAVIERTKIEDSIVRYLHGDKLAAQVVMNVLDWARESQDRLVAGKGGDDA